MTELSKPELPRELPRLKLRRGFTFWALLALSVSSIIGTGMFFGPAIGAGLAGNSSIFAWIILAVFAIYTSMCFAELSSMFPSAGGIYEYSKKAYGRFTSFLVGWTAWLVGNITTTLLVVAAIEYLTPSQFPLIIKIVISLFFILLLNVISYMGIEASSAAMAVFMLITALVIGTIIAAGLMQIKIGNFRPLFTHPWTQVFTTMFFIAETYFGWEAVTYLAEETENPEKTVPRAIILSTIIVAAVTLLLVFVLMGILPWELLSTTETPLFSVGQIIFGSFGASMIGLGIYIVLIGSAAGGIISTPRLLLAMARDKLFFQQLTAIHPVYKTPYKAIIFQTIISIIIVFFGFGQYRILLALLVPMACIMYILVLLSVPILRRKHPDIKRHYTAPFGNFLPVITAGFFASIVAAWLITQNEINIFFMAVSIILAGIPLYMLFEMYYSPGAIVRVNDFFARLSLFTERITLPWRVQREIRYLLGNVKGKTILEYGCGVGTITLLLSEEVGPGGKIIATSLSKHELSITKSRLTKKGRLQVQTIYDEHNPKRVHDNVPKVDAIVSVGYMGYVQDIERVLKDMNKKLEINGRLLFLDYDKFFWIIPNIDWLTDDNRIREIFDKAGFHVGVIRKKGWLWQYVYIYGIKHKNIN